MICIPVIAGTHAEALATIKESATKADVVELRMDLIYQGKVGEFIDAARSTSPSLKVLVTNRPGKNSNQSDEKKRVDVLIEAMSFGADFVDVELATDKVLREKIITCNRRLGGHVSLIISHHDFIKTPSAALLKRYFNDCIKAGADIAKIVTLARSPQDNLMVLSLIPYARKKGRDVIAFCMGNHGKISRVIAPLLGSMMTFASLKRGAESATGQLTVGEMKEILRILGRNRNVTG